LKIVVAATPSVAIPTLNWLKSSDHELVSVITQPDRPAGRGRTLKQSPVSLWAEEKKVRCHKFTSLSELASAISGSDLLLTIGFGVLLPAQILDLPINGCLNLHFSLLPRWRGAAPVQRAIEAGDLLSGVTVFRLDEGMDTGPIYSIKRFALDSDITSDELFDELQMLGVEAVQESLEAILDGQKPIPQSNEGASRAAKITKEECEIDWNSDAQSISRKIRAFTSLPGAWSRFRGEIVKIDSVHETEIELEPGQIKEFSKELLVGTKSCALSIGFLTPSGKTRMDARSWLNGARILDGESFG
jgi:methionyl-tRNA formyltransferase